MKLNMRRATLEDAAVLGQIDYDAFKALGDAHNFPPDFPSVDAAIGTVTSLISNPGVYSVVAEVDGKIAGKEWSDGEAPPSTQPLVRQYRGDVGMFLREGQPFRLPLAFFHDPFPHG